MKTTSKLKQAIQEKIEKFESLRIDPNYQSAMEQNAVLVTLRELRYLDSIVEYEEVTKQIEGKIHGKAN